MTRHSNFSLAVKAAFTLGSAVLATIPSPVAAVTNPSFESASAWVYSENDPNGRFSGGYSSTWASDGTASYLLARGTGSNSGGGWWGQIQQPGINLSGITTLIFDVHAVGIDANALRIYIDSNLVSDFYVAASSFGGIVDLFNKSIDISGYSGLHALTIRITSDGDTSPADPKLYYIDNLRTLPVPEPAVYSMLLLGFVGLMARRRVLRRNAA